MRYRIRRTTQFKKDVKRMIKRGKDIERLIQIIQDLAEGHSLASQYNDHPLKGHFSGKRDCHIETDWIMI